MSLTAALNSAMSGLRSNSRMTELISENIANALTPGYVRREVVVSATGDIAPGVRIEGIRDLGDPAMVSFRREAEADLGHAEHQLRFLSRVENRLGLPGSGNNLSDLMSRLEASLVAARGAPESDTRLSAVVASASDVAQRLNATYETIRMERNLAERGIESAVGELKDALEEVHSLNYRITESLSKSIDASGLKLRRTAVVDRINELVPVREVQREFGKIALFTHAGQGLLDGPPAELSFSSVPTLDESMTVQNGALANLLISGKEADGRKLGGDIGALFEIRDGYGPDIQAKLDAFSNDLANLVVSAPLSSEAPPLLAHLFVAERSTDPATSLAGLARTIKVNPAFVPEEGGSPALLRDGSSGGPSGDATRLDAFLNNLTQGAGPSGHSLFSSADALISEIGSQRVRTEDAQARHAARLDHAQRAEAQAGVDTDSELQHLLEVEKAYAANARVIETINTLFDDLLRM